MREKYGYAYYLGRKNFLRILFLLLFAIGIGTLIFTQGRRMLEHGSTDRPILTVEPDPLATHPIHFMIPKVEEGEDFVVVNNNEPLFTKEELSETQPYEQYTRLDDLQRVGPATALLDSQNLPTEYPVDPVNIKPTGWSRRKVRGGSVYKQTHLIGATLSGEWDSPMNVMTGTDYFRTRGIRPIERFVDDYLDKHPDEMVLYRVTPLFVGNNLLASGVFLEGYSVNDGGNGVQFHLFVPNQLPGSELNYQTGGVRSGGLFDWMDFLN